MPPLDNHDNDRRRSPDIVRRHCCPSQSRSHTTCSCSIHFPAGQNRQTVQRQRKRRGRRSNGRWTNGKTFERLICFGGAAVISLDLEMLTMVRKFCDFVQSKETQCITQPGASHSRTTVIAAPIGGGANRQGQQQLAPPATNSCALSLVALTHFVFAFH